MKRIIALVLSIVLFASVLPVALAAGDPPKRVKKYNWETVRQVMYDYDYTGYTSKQESIGLRYWLPNQLMGYEITEEGLELGLVAFYQNMDETFSLEVDILDMETTHDAYMADLKAAGFKRVRQVDVNGRLFVLYEDPNYTKMDCNVAGTVCEDGSVLEFVFYGEEDDFSLFTSMIIGSIRPIDQR